MSFLYISFLLGSDHLLGWQMMSESIVYTSFADEASHHTLNLPSTAWLIYEPSSQLLSSGSTYLGPSTNNIVEYSAIVELLLDVISSRIQHLVVHLDSQLVVL
jgi:ribonuclease HI